MPNDTARIFSLQEFRSPEGMIAMKAHPAAELFSLLPEAELKELAEDIKENGQRLPIITWNGMILDGRNRWLACGLAGKTPITEDRSFQDEAEATRFVISINLKRRHLNESQRALIAARVESVYAKNAKDRQATSTGGSAPQLKANLPQADKGQARDQAARDFNVSPRAVQTAKTVLKEGIPALVDAVKSGKIPVSTAAVIAKTEPETQRSIVSSSEKVTARSVQQATAPKAEPPKPKPAPPVQSVEAEDQGLPFDDEEPEDDEDEEEPEGPEAAIWNKASASWNKLLRDIWIQVLSVRDLGGIEKVTAKWPKSGVNAQLLEMRKMAAFCNDCVAYLERRVAE